MRSDPPVPFLLMREASSTVSKYRSLIGRPGVVYILENDGLREGWVKIGCSGRSGYARARDLNHDASTGTPGVYKCIYQLKTIDCGSAELEVFRQLRKYRRGKWGQEFFAVDISFARSVIQQVCVGVDRNNDSATLFQNQTQNHHHLQPVDQTTSGTASPPEIKGFEPISDFRTFPKKTAFSRGSRAKRWMALVLVIAVVVFATKSHWRSAPEQAVVKKDISTSGSSAEHPNNKQAARLKHALPRNEMRKSSAPAASRPANTQSGNPTSTEESPRRYDQSATEHSPSVKSEAEEFTATEKVPYPY